MLFRSATCLTFYVLKQIIFVLKNLRVHEENIKRNVASAGARLFSSGVLKLLLDKGFSRRKSYSAAQDLFRNPLPVEKVKEILEEKAIETLVKSGFVVVAVGGGGIPVYHYEEKDIIKGCAAVIDKDFASALLA